MSQRGRNAGYLNFQCECIGYDYTAYMDLDVLKKEPMKLITHSFS